MGFSKSVGKGNSTLQKSQCFKRRIENEMGLFN
jgi:hypothetical protein